MKAIKFVRTRGVAMQEAGDQNKGTMAAIIGLEPEKVEDICAEASAIGCCTVCKF